MFRSSENSRNVLLLKKKIAATYGPSFMPASSGTGLFQPSSTEYVSNTSQPLTLFPYYSYLIMQINVSNVEMESIQKLL